MKVIIKASEYRSELIGQEFNFADIDSSTLFLTETFGSDAPKLEDVSSILNCLRGLSIEFKTSKDKARIDVSI